MADDLEAKVGIGLEHLGYYGKLSLFGSRHGNTVCSEDYLRDEGTRYGIRNTTCGFNLLALEIHQRSRWSIGLLVLAVGYTVAVAVELGSAGVHAYSALAEGIHIKLVTHAVSVEVKRTA